MNIFVLDEDPLQAAMMACDAHVTKMILETSEMMAMALALYDAPRYADPLCPDFNERHWRHPCSRWVRECRGNYEWAAMHLAGLVAEFYYRRQKHHAYLRDGVVDLLIPAPKMPDGDRTPFVLAIADDCKTDDPVASYRLYYNRHKRHLFKWTRRSRPDWIDS